MLSINAITMLLVCRLCVCIYLQPEWRMEIRSTLCALPIWISCDVKSCRFLFSSQAGKRAKQCAMIRSGFSSFLNFKWWNILCVRARSQLNNHTSLSHAHCMRFENLYESWMSVCLCVCARTWASGKERNLNVRLNCNCQIDMDFDILLWRQA